MLAKIISLKGPDQKLQGSLEGNPMARDSQAALVALNRFGLGARGDASGDFVNAASDPRGFVKAELDRPNGALLEASGLQSTPALAQTVFAYQFEIVQARNAAAKSGAAKPQAAAVTNGAPDIAGKAAAMEAANANAAMAPAETMQPPKP